MQNKKKLQTKSNYKCHVSDATQIPVYAKRIKVLWRMIELV